MTGTLYLVSVGPGSRELIPPLAEAALRKSEIIVAYDLYLTWIQPWIAGKEIRTLPLTQERERARLAIDEARAGRTVALISSGDIGIYAMAALAFEDMAEDDVFDVQVIPGITSANACASLLGSPLSHDFATLSLSDLLCPWEWIETRARHIALADLAVVFYNVQSRQRQEGVYRILDIMLEHKRPDTLCGIVHNAYREGQKTQILTLSELRTQRFDMLTTLLIGNRFTRRKRQWIYTPRGYHHWPDRSDVTSKILPERAVWVFSGTRDGNRLANAITEADYPVVVSSASAYGSEQAQRQCPKASVISGRLGMERRRELMRRDRALAIVDATHPYATDISRQLISLSEELGLPYVRYERPIASASGEGHHCADSRSAAMTAMTRGNRLFLATGSKDLATFLDTPGADQHQWFVRIAPDPEHLQRVLDLGIPRAHICVMQGPFSQASNEALWRDWSIDCVITKESGDEGGFAAKAAAAKQLNIPLIIIDRPTMDYPNRHGDFASIIAGLPARSSHE